MGTIADAFGARYSLALGAVATIAAGAFGLSSVRRGRVDLAGPAPAEVPLPVGTTPSLLDPTITPRAS